MLLSWNKKENEIWITETEHVYSLLMFHITKKSKFKPQLHSDFLLTMVMWFFSRISHDFFCDFFQLSHQLCKGGYTCDFSPHAGDTVQQNFQIKLHHYRKQKITRATTDLRSQFLAGIVPCQPTNDQHLQASVWCHYDNKINMSLISAMCCYQLTEKF